MKQLTERSKSADEITYQEKLFLLQRIDLDEQIQVQTIQELRQLINLRQIPKDSISLYQTLDLFIEKAEVDIPAVTRQALFGIRNIAITYGIPKDRNDLVINLLVSKLNYGTRQEKYSSIKTIGELVKTNQIPQKDSIKIFNLMLENVNDKSETISSIALNCIRQLLMKMKIDPERAEYVFDLLIDKSDSKFDSTKCVAMQGIRNIVGRYIIPVDKIKEALGILTDQIDSSHNKVQRNAIEGIGIFIKQDKVSYSDLSDTLELISFKTEDTEIVSIASFKVLFNNLKNNNYLIRQSVLNALLQINYQDEQIISNLEHFIQIDGSEQIREIAEILKSSSSERHSIILDIIQQRGIFKMDGDIKTVSQKSEERFESEDIISPLIYRIKFSPYKERFTALRELAKLIKNNEVPEDRLKEIFDLLLSYSSHGGDMVGGLARHWAVQLLDKVSASQIEIEHIINLLLSHINDSVDQGSGSVKSIVKLIEIRMIPENRIKEIFEYLKIKTFSSIKKVSNKAIEGVRLLEEIIQIQGADSASEVSHSTIDLSEEVMIEVRTINTGLSELDSLLSQVSIIKRKQDVKQVWKKIEKFIKNRSIPNEKAEEFLSFLEAKAMGNPGRTAKKSLKVIEILIDKYDILLESAEHLLKLIQRQFYKENVSQQKLVKLINILAQKNLIPEVLKDEILDLLRSSLSKANSKMAKSITEGIKFIAESHSDKIDHKMELVAKEHHIKTDDIKETDIDTCALTNDFSPDLSQELRLAKISLKDINKLKSYVDLLVLESTNIQIKIEALPAIKKLISKSKIPETDIDFIIQLLLNNAIHQDQGVRHEAILAIVAVITKYNIASHQLTNILNLLIAAANNHPPINTDALQGIANFIMKDYLPEEKIDEVFSLLMLKANQKYIWAKAAATRGITRLIEKEKLDHEHILKVIELLIYNVKYGPEKIDAIALKGIGILAGKNKFAEESIEDILILLINKAKNVDRSAKNNALDAIAIITKKYDLTQKLIPEVLELVLNIPQQTDPKAEQLIEALKENYKILEFLVSLFETSDAEYKKCAVQIIARLNYSVDQIIFSLENIISREYLRSKILSDLILLKSMLTDRVDLIEVLNSKIDTLESIECTMRDQIVNGASREIHFSSMIRDPAIINEAIKDDFHAEQVEDKAKNIQPMHSKEITSLTSSIKTISLLRDNSEEMAKLVLARGKLLLKANTLPSSDLDLEQEFINELAMCLRVVYKNLLDLSERNQDLKLNFIKKLASELKREGKIYINDGKFTVNEELQEDSEVFFSSAIISVKEQLKQHTYFDELSSVIIPLEIRYVTKLEYYSKNLLLSRDEIIYEAGQIGGIEAINKLIELAEDSQVASAIISAAKEYGTQNILNILFASQKQMNEPTSLDLSKLPEISNTQDNPKFYKEDYGNNLIISSFVVKEMIETIPMIKYVINDIFHIHYSWPEFIDNNFFKISLHNIAVNIGIYSITGKVDIFASSLSTTIYGGRILAYEYLANQKQINFQNQEDKSIDGPYEFIEKCGFDILAQTSLGIIGSFISGSPILYDVVISASIGGMQCYSLYNQEENDIAPTMVSTLIPYIMDSIVIYGSIKNMQFDLTNQFGQMLAVKQSFALMSATVMTDYTTKLVMNSIGDQLYEYCNDIAGNIYGYFYGEEN